MYFDTLAGTLKPLTDGATGSALGTLASGKTWIITVTVDELRWSITARDTSGIGEFRINGPRLGLTINNVYVFNSDPRGTASGSYIGPLSIRKGTVSAGLLAARVATEGVGPTVHWTLLSDGTSVRIALPTAYDSRKPYKTIVMFHGRGGSELNWTGPSGNANDYTVAEAFLAAGYIVVSAANGAFTWSAQPSLDGYYKAYQYVRDHYRIGPLVFYGNSMGGIESLLSLADRRIPGVVAWIGTSPAASLAANYADSSTFASDIRSIYGMASDGSDYASKAAGHDPTLMIGSAFRGVPMLVLYATDDTTVLPIHNWLVFKPIVAPYATSITEITATGGHTTGSIASNASTFVSFADTYTAG